MYSYVYLLATEHSAVHEHSSQIALYTLIISFATATIAEASRCLCCKKRISFRTVLYLGTCTKNQKGNNENKAWSYIKHLWEREREKKNNCTQQQSHQIAQQFTTIPIRQSRAKRAKPKPHHIFIWVHFFIFRVKLLKLWSCSLLRLSLSLSLASFYFAK